MLLILFPRLSNGNVLWTCDNCGTTAEVSCPETNAVALYCVCTEKTRPRCNDRWYNGGLYFQRIPLEIRLSGNKFLRELHNKDNGLI